MYFSLEEGCFILYSTHLVSYYLANLCLSFCSSQMFKSKCFVLCQLLKKRYFINILFSLDGVISTLYTAVSNKPPQMEKLYYSVNGNEWIVNKICIFSLMMQIYKINYVSELYISCNRRILEFCFQINLFLKIVWTVLVQTYTILIDLNIFFSPFLLQPHLNL